MQVTALEQIELKQAQDLLHSQAKLAHEAYIGQQQIHAHGQPDLGHHGIARGAQKGFDLQILLDPFEEQFDLSASLVDRRNGASGQMERVSQKDVMFAGIRVTVTNAAKPDRTLLSLCTGKADSLIRGDAR